jgi:hypothetical protein
MIRWARPSKNSAPVECDCGGNCDWCFLRQQIYVRRSTAIMPGWTLTFSSVMSRSFTFNRVRCPLPAARRAGPSQCFANGHWRERNHRGLGVKNGLAIMASMLKPQARQVEVAVEPDIRAMCRAVKLRDERTLISQSRRKTLFSGNSRRDEQARRPPFATPARLKTRPANPAPILP